MAGGLAIVATRSWSDAGAAASTSNLARATAVVSTWSLTRLARETVVVSPRARNFASLESASAQGYGGFLLSGSRAPRRPSLGVGVPSLALALAPTPTPVRARSPRSHGADW